MIEWRCWIENEGVSLNNANYLTHGSGQTWILRTKSEADGGDVVAMVQACAGVTVEWYTPCKIENPANALTEKRAVEMVLAMVKERRTGFGYQFRDLKKLLAGFNLKQICWTEKK